MKNISRGFTIIELAVVIVVIGILAAITIVSYGGIQDKAIETAQRSDLKAIATNIDIMAARKKTNLQSTSVWRKAIMDANLYDDYSYDGVATKKSFAICAKGDNYAIGGWADHVKSESTAENMIYVINGKLKELTWNPSVTGTTTLQKYCKQIVTATGIDTGSGVGASFSTWSYNDSIRNAPDL